MKRKSHVVSGAFAAFICLAVAALPAIAGPAGVKTATIRIKNGSEQVSAFLAEPTSPGRHPALVVIHEWWGLVPWVKEQAEKFAAQGYVALAPDLYHGQSTTDPSVGFKLMRSTPRERAVGDLKASYDYLASLPNVEPGKIGSVGWCMGGGYSLQLAIQEPRLAACVVNYGELPTSAAEIAAIHAPVLGNFGGEDRGITPAKVEVFDKAMKADGKSINVKIYPDANHAFENPNNKTGYRAADAANAWTRMINFLNQKLK